MQDLAGLRLGLQRRYLDMLHILRAGHRIFASRIPKCWHLSSPSLESSVNCLVCFCTWYPRPRPVALLLKAAGTDIGDASMWEENCKR